MFHFVTLYVVPLLVMIFCYTRILTKINGQLREGKGVCDSLPGATSSSPFSSLHATPSGVRLHVSIPLAVVCGRLTRRRQLVSDVAFSSAPFRPPDTLAAKLLHNVVQQKSKIRLFFLFMWY